MANNSLLTLYHQGNLLLGDDGKILADNKYQCADQFKSSCRLALSQSIPLVILVLHECV